MSLHIPYKSVIATVTITTITGKLMKVPQTGSCLEGPVIHVERTLFGHDEK